MNPPGASRCVGQPISRAILGILLLWSLVPARAGAQANLMSSRPDATDEGEASGAEPSLQPIPGASVSIKSEETNAILLSMRDRHQPSKEIESIRAALPEALGRYEELLELTERRANSTISVREFEQLERRWLRIQRTVEDRQRQVQQRTHSLDRDLQTLQELRIQWDLTIETAGETGLNEALVSVARSSRDAVKQLEQRFGVRRAELQTLEEQIEHALERVREAFAALDGVARNARQRFATRDAPPLWTLLANPPPRVRHLEQLQIVWEEGKRNLREFLASEEQLLISLALLTIALTVGFALLSRRARSLLENTPELEASSRVLNRPFSSALIAVLLLLVFAAPEAPRIIDDGVILLLFVPLFRVLPAPLATKQRGLLIALVVVNVLGRLGEILLHRSPLQRLVLLLGALLVCIVLLRLLRTRVREGIRPLARSQRAMRTVEWLAFLTAASSIVSNVLGYITLSSMLLRALSLSAYLALAAYVIYFVVQGVLPVILRTATARRFAIVRLHADSLLRRSLWVVRLGLLVLWVEETLDLLILRRSFLILFRRILTAEARFGELAFSLGDVLSFALTVWAAFALSRLVRFVLAEDVYPRLALPRGVPNAISTALHYALLLLGFFLAMAATGIDLSRFAILAGAFGLGVGFGLQNIINNFVSGLILIVERPIMPGDTVQIGDLAGEVKRIGMRSSTVRTWQGAEVIVPNGNLISNEVINWTLSDSLRRLDVTVGVAYGTDPRRVVELLVGVARQQPDVVAHPEPAALFMGFGDSSLDFELRFWTARLQNFLGLKSEVTLAVHQALQEAGITIPFPQRDLHLKSMEPALADALHRPRAPTGKNPADS